jgi:protein required for attachment to host cells
MKFSRPINREVDIDGNTFVVTLDEGGIAFRIKGKRKTAQVQWALVLDIAQGEQGSPAREHLGVSRGESGRAESEAESSSAPTYQQANRPDESTDEELGRTASAGETGSQS